MSMEIEEITVRQMDNGYTVKVHYKKDGETWGQIKNFIAANITEVLSIVEEWCGKAKNEHDTLPPF